MSFACASTDDTPAVSNTSTPASPTETSTIPTPVSSAQSSGSQNPVPNTPTPASPTETSTIFTPVSNAQGSGSQNPVSYTSPSTLPSPIETTASIFTTSTTSSLPQSSSPYYPLLEAAVSFPGLPSSTTEGALAVPVSSITGNCIPEPASEVANSFATSNLTTHHHTHHHHKHHNHNHHSQTTLYKAPKPKSTIWSE
jgi:hypothetical protein